MARRVKALVEPNLLIWAREKAGLSIAQTAKKAAVSTESITKWEAGEDAPTVKQLRRLSRIYKRPLSVFYLPDPPRDFQALRDFRRLPGEEPEPQTPALLYEIRRAHERRGIALELAEELGEMPHEFALTATLQDNPEELAQRIRATLPIDISDQRRLEGTHGPFNYWRSALEQIGVLVFQFRDVAPQEARGFSIAQTSFPVIAVNIKDAPSARVFTLLHEFCHLSLREGGLCDVDEEDGRPADAQRVEVFCNHVAGAVLVPRDELLAEEIVGESRKSVWTDDELRFIARQFGVSREVVLRRLLLLGRATHQFYQRKRRDFEEEYRRLAERQRSGFAPPPAVAVATAGHSFTGLVLTSYRENKITASDVSGILSIRLKHLPAVEAEIYGISERASA